MEKIRLGISACLLGEPVRFDGGHQWDRFITDTLGQYVEFVPVCPEAECGLGVPREAMRLVGDPDAPHLVTVRTKIDLTDRMVTWARKRVEELEQEDLRGFIFKSKSPSSGMERVRVYQRDRPGLAGTPGRGDVRPNLHGALSPPAGGRGGAAPRSCPPGKLHRAHLRVSALAGTPGGQAKYR